MSSNRAKFKADVNKMWPGEWSLGVGLSHSSDETYIYINLIKISISIGWLVD